MDEKKSGICRVCLATVKKKSMSLFQEYKNYSIFNHINAIANIQIREDDGLPDKICSGCLLDLETAINFKQKCESSNLILQTSTLASSADSAVEVDVNIVKKEEPDLYSEIAFLNDDTYFDTDFNDIDKKPEKSILTKVDLGIRKSRSIDLHLQCDDCGGFFKSKCKLRVHWKQVHLKEMLRCLNCKRSFKSIRAFKRHQNEKSKSCLAASNFRIEGEGKSRMFYCKECEYKSLRMKDMITHWVIHTGDRPFECEVCQRTFTQQSSLQAHKESSHKDFKVEITCHFCGKLIKGRSRIYRHLKIHTDKGLPCPICQKTLKNRHSLTQHMQRHSGVKSYTCEKCASTFYTSAELSNHKRMVHNKGKYWYKCDRCDYKALRNETLKKHKAKHTDSNLPCTVCGMFFESTQKLILHQRRHFDEKKYQCPHCEVKFFRRDSVGKHVRAKHRITMAINHRTVGFTVKEESLDKKFANKYDEIVEVEVSPANGN